MPLVSPQPVLLQIVSAGISSPSTELFIISIGCTLGSLKSKGSETVISATSLLIRRIIPACVILHLCNPSSLVSSLQNPVVSPSNYTVQGRQCSLNTVSSSDHLVLVDDAATTDVRAQVAQGYLPRELMCRSLLSPNDSSISIANNRIALGLGRSCC